MTIIDFLTARLDEDARAAHAASPGTGGPPRARADVAAKKRIVAEYARARQEGLAVAASADGGSLGALYAWRRAVEHLAAVYASHPDYDDAWRV